MIVLPGVIEGIMLRLGVGCPDIHGKREGDGGELVSVRETALRIGALQGIGEGHERRNRGRGRGRPGAATAAAVRSAAGENTRQREDKNEAELAETVGFGGPGSIVHGQVLAVRARFGRSFF